MHAEDLVIDESRNWHAVEHVLEFLPDSDTVAPLALVIEAVHSVNLTALVVSAQQEKVFSVLDLVCHQEHDGLQGLSATVNIVSEEEVVGLWREASIFEKPQQVWELSMCVA